MNSNTDAIKAAMLNAGIEPPRHIEIDGRIHRYDMGGKRNKAGWCWFKKDPSTGKIFGAFGDHRQGITHKYCDKGAVNNPEAMAAIERAYQQRQQERQKAQAAAASKTVRIWRESQPADKGQTYLKRKDIGAHGTRQDRHDNILIPVFVNGELASLQFIKPDGSKRFLKEGKTRGGYFCIGEPGERILIAEGFATAATLFEETSHCTYVAFNAGNLSLVAEWVARQHPQAEIIICGDNDHATEGNPGKTAAIKAAKTIGCKWIIPDFTGLNPGDKDTDYNDLKRLQQEAGQ